MSLRAALRLSTERALGRGLLGMPSALLRRIAGPPIVVDAEPLDVEAQALLAIARRLRARRQDEMSLAEARRDMDANARVLAPPLREMAHVEERTAFGRRLRVYVPPAHARLRDAPALLYIHGGGFVVGSLDAYDSVCRYLATEACAVVLSLDYRLAPEHKFPAAADDATSAFRWLVANTKELGLDPARLAIGGDSAGGNLAAVVCHDQRASKGPRPAFQLLVYPATDMTRSMRSHALFASGFFLEKETIDWYLAQYLTAEAEHRDPRASPLLQDRFDELPPAMVVTAGFDPLRDEGIAYAEKLARAGVPVIHRHDAGMFHGYVAAAGGLTVGREALAHVAHVLRDALERSG